MPKRSIPSRPGGTRRKGKPMTPRGLTTSVGNTRGRANPSAMARSRANANASFKRSSPTRKAKMKKMLKGNSPSRRMGGH